VNIGKMSMYVLEHLVIVAAYWSRECYHIIYDSTTALYGDQPACTDGKTK